MIAFYSAQKQEPTSMWRAFFMAVGICLVLAGFESLVVEKAVLAAKPNPKDQPAMFGPLLAPSSTRDMTPPDWMPWSFLSSGAVTILYSMTLKRGGGDGK